MHSKVQRHFKKADQKLFKVLQKIGKLEEIKPIRSEEYFFRLCRGIIGQQLSGKVADTFVQRFLKLFSQKLGIAVVTPGRLLKLPKEKLRGIGISWSKVEYLKNLAQKVEKKEVVLEHLQTLPNEEVTAELIKVKGIGNWTAEMFLMFSLGRQDVFSHGDLGLKKAIEKIYNLKNPAKSTVEKLSQKWAPYRTWACRILWKSYDNKE